MLISGAACSVFAFVAAGQSAKTPVTTQRGTSVVMTAEKAIELAEQGHCKEGMGMLKRTLSSSADGDMKKRAGLLGVRCAMTLDDRVAVGEFLGVLSRAFPRDPEVLYVTIHAYSDLSTRAAQQLAMTV